MDSALRPREIQSRIRAGQSLDEVARLAGVPAEQIEAYAAPVLAEREHVAGLALAAAVRRRGEGGAHRTLRPVVRERLTAHQVDPDLVDWDAWRNEDRRWSVQATWTDDNDEPHAATFYFDLHSRFSVAADEEARWLIADGAAAELTAEQENDELALVRAVSPTVPPVGADTEPPAGADTEPTVALSEAGPDPAQPTVDDDRPAAQPGGATAGEHIVPEPPSPDASADFLPRSVATPLEIGEAVEAELDSYGLIPDGRTELDVLYDMLGGIAEDSINIYAGLADPVVPEIIGESQPDSDENAKVPESTPRFEPEPAPSEAPQPPAELQPKKPAAESEPAPEGDQPALTNDAEPTTSFKPGAAKRRRKGRAQVPSWEEIMFGSPKTD